MGTSHNDSDSGLPCERMTPEIFLERVWKNWEGWGFVAHNHKHWQQQAMDKRQHVPVGWEYFSLHRFSKPLRRREFVLPTRWLGADLDESPPWKCTPQPTVAIETSPGRYQALWFLDRTVGRENMERLSHILAVVNQADHGSWTATKMLRLPGSVNRKYWYKPDVRVLWWTSEMHDAQDIADLAPEDWCMPETANTHENGELPEVTTEYADMLWAKYQQHVVDLAAFDMWKRQRVRDRSATGWRFAQALAEAGARQDEIYVMHMSRPWCKWRSRPHMAWTQAREAVERLGAAES